MYAQNWNNEGLFLTLKSSSRPHGKKINLNARHSRALLVHMLSRLKQKWNQTTTKRLTLGEAGASRGESQLIQRLEIVPEKRKKKKKCFGIFSFQTSAT